MSATLSMQDRIARTRRQQTRALDSASPDIAARVAPPEARMPNRGPAANEAPAARPAPAPAQRVATMLLRNPDFTDLIKEMTSLLPALTVLYGYQQADIDRIHEAVAADRAGALEEVRALVRQWRIDVVTNGLDAKTLPDGALLVPRGVAERARTQFRMDVMGKTEDEGGVKYAPTVLDWRPEGDEYLIKGPALAATGATAVVAPPAPKPAPKKRKP